ncbi:adenosine deaminase-like growth [Ceratobasidium sp. AG-I]|nr:adenosine deaminase-like growth [Ceratobasidium sp. AG-I]
MSQLEEYNARRKALIYEERALRFDSKAIAGATPQELRAAEIVNQLRAREAQEIWSSSTEKLTYPGMEFLVAKETIVQTELYQIIKRMPKGALLHGHMDAMYDASFLYKLAQQHSNMHIRVSSPITSASAFPPPEFMALSLDLTALYSSNPSLASEEYVVGSWTPLGKARAEFEMGGPEVFDEWIVGSMMIHPREAYAEFNTSAKIWKKFQSTFSVTEGIMRYRPIAKAYMRQVMLSAVEDGISHVEVRFGFPRFGIHEDGSETLVHRDWLVIFEEAVNETRAIMKEQDREGDFLGAKIIYTALRFLTNEQLAWFLEDCMTLKKEFPHIVAGFDLVGHEDTGRPLFYYAESLLGFQAETKKRGLDIPFLFHAGETLDDGGVADINLYDAILLGTKRIGHGFSLAKHPLLMQKCKERGIAIEVCPISNEILRLTSSMPMHPLPVLLNNGLTVALCPDDPAIFGNMGLSFDFYQVIVASEVTNILSLGQMARQSLEHSLLEPEDKKRAIELWEARWAAFIEEIVASG